MKSNNKSKPNRATCNQSPRAHNIAACAAVGTPMPKVTCIYRISCNFLYSSMFLSLPSILSLFPVQLSKLLLVCARHSVASVDPENNLNFVLELWYFSD
jgi:hypothetical protein